LQNIVSFIGLFCKRDLWMTSSSSSECVRERVGANICAGVYVHVCTTPTIHGTWRLNESHRTYECVESHT